MALPSSGQISVDDIRTELDVSGEVNVNFAGLAEGSFGTINTNSSSTPNDEAPHSLSEWYSYDHDAAPAYSNSHYYSNDGTNDYVTGSKSGSTPFVINTTQDLSFNFWVRIKSSSKNNETLWNFGSTQSNGNNRIFMQYVASLNRMLCRIRTNSVNFDRQFALHDNSSVTGISNSSTGWTTSQRGNVNSDNFCMITLTYDASQSTAANAFKLYWNANELTTTANSNNGTRSARNADFFRFCENIHTTASAGNANVDLDEFKVYTDILSSSEISTLYNSGTITDSTQTHSSSLLTEWTFDSDDEDSAGLYSTSIVGGSRTSY
jgi:hypothetical protein